MSEYMNTTKAAQFLGLSPWTLIKWRSIGKGPKHLKMSTCVRYRATDLADYAAGSLIDPADKALAGG